MKPLVDNRDTLYAVISTELKILGVKVPKIKKLKTNSKQERLPHSQGHRVFGVNLMDQEWVSEDDCYLPKFPVVATKFLEFYNTNEGLFRKAGSLLRQKELKVKIENDENWDDAQPNDVASLLKQWLRELPEPLIPSYLHNVFARCLHLDSEPDKIHSVLLSCLLLPAENLNTLVYLLSFLCRLVSHSKSNKMDAHNLAIIMTPNLLHTLPEQIDKVNTIHHTDLVELLITNADKVGQIPCVIAEQMQLKDPKIAELEPPVDALECSSSVQKKRRKNGPVHGFVHEIRKLVGQNLTPVSCTRNQSLSEVQRSGKAVHSTSKRKADLEYPSDAAKKRAMMNYVDSGQSLLSTPVKMSPSSLMSSASSKKTTFSPLQCKPALLKSKRRKREKSAHQPYHVGMKWLSAQNVNESLNLNSSFSQCVKMDEKSCHQSPDCKNICSFASPVGNNTPGNSSVIYFPALNLSSSSLSLISPVVNQFISSPNHHVDESENVFPSIEKHSFLSNSVNVSANVAEKLDLQDVKVSPLMIKRENSCKSVPVSSPLKAHNKATRISEKRLSRNSRKQRNLKNLTFSKQADTASLNPGLQTDNTGKVSQSSPVQTRGTDNSEVIPAPKSDFLKNLADNSTLGDVPDWCNIRNRDFHCKPSTPVSSNQSYCSNSNRRLDRRTSRSCTNISEMRIDSSNDVQLTRGNSKKRATTKSSLRRGRPNTIKTGLPTEFSQKYLTESSALTKLEKQKDVSTSSPVDFKSSSFLASSQTYVHENKSYTPKNIRT